VPASAVLVAASRAPLAALSWRPAAVVVAASAVVAAVALTRVGGPASVRGLVRVAAEVEPAVGCAEPAAVEVAACGVLPAALSLRAAAVAQVSVVGAAGRRVGRPTAARAADRQR
jgi:hypothetical protein